MTQEQIISEIAKEARERSKVPVYERDVYMVLSSLQVTEDFWELIFYSEVPTPALAEIIKELEKRGIVVVKEEGISLTEKGMKLISTLNIPRRYYRKCHKCSGRGVDLDDFRDVYQEFVKIAERRPEAIQKYDQGYVTPETTVSRIAFMATKMDLQNREILIIGDDDLTSIAACLSKMPRRVQVLEIDDRLIEFINGVAKEYGFPLEAERYDIREPLPEEHYGKYDVFFTDPSETEEALKLFLSRGICGLKGPRCAGYFGITRVEASLEKWYKLQKMLNEMRIVITDMIHNFNVYVNWEYAENTRAWRISPVHKGPKKEWYTSTLYRIETLEGFVKINEPAKEDIYEDYESSTV